MIENLDDLIASQDFKATQKYAQENFQQLESEQLKKLLDYWISLGEVKEAKSYYLQFIQLRLSYRDINQLKSLKNYARELLLPLSVQIELMILMESWNELMEIYEQNYDDFFLNQKLRLEKIEPIINLIKIYRGLYLDYRFEIFCLEVDLLEDLMLMEKTELQGSLESKKELLAKLVIGATMYPWLYCSICIFLHRVSAQSQLLQFLKEKNILRLVKGRIHKNRMLNFIVKTYVAKPDFKEESESEKKKLYEVDYSLIRSGYDQQHFFRDKIELDQKSQALAGLSFDEAKKRLRGDSLLDYLTIKWRQGQGLEVLNFIQKNTDEIWDSDLELIGILYLEGEIYESMGLKNEAQKNYQKVFLLDANYKKVRLKVDVT